MRIAILAGLFLLVGVTLVAADAAVPTGGWKSLSGAVYFVHGGTLADRQSRSAKDRKLSIVIDGPAAREIFDSIGPDLPDTCSGERRDRARDKKGIHCVYTDDDKASTEGPYRCWVGLDLRTGDSIGLVSC